MSILNSPAQMPIFQHNSPYGPLYGLGMQGVYTMVSQVQNARMLICRIAGWSLGRFITKSS